LVISKNNIIRFALMVGFHDQLKAARLEEKLEGHKARGMYAERFTAEVEAIIPDGVEAVYDCTVDDVHRFDANGIVVHNCGEISLSMLGGYCVIADVVPYHAQRGFHPASDCTVWDDDAEEAFRAAVRALLRVNMMDCLYGKEVQRTNRIGVGMTGLHEYAWARFGFGWKDLVDENKSIEFWRTLSRFSNACVDEAAHYSEKLGTNMPHSVTTVKPAGCATPDTTVKTEDGIVTTLEEIFALNGYTLDELRAMPDGTWVDVDETVRVMDENNEPKDVTRLYVNGMKPVFEIEFEDGHTVKLTGNHKLKTANGWKRVDELTEDDEILSY
jgi:hypothetical protein